LIPNVRQALRYALLSFISLGAIGLGDVVLRYTYSLYLTFEPKVFLHEGWLLLAAAAMFACVGAWADRPEQAQSTIARSARALLLSLVFVALFQVFRQALADAMPLPSWAKAGAILACTVAGVLVAWLMRPEAATRLGNAACLAMVTLFALQPGMAGYMLHALVPEPVAESSVRQAATPAARRSIVVVFDEWDMEVSQRTHLFEQASMQTLLSQSFFAENALPAGPNTLESIPSMLLGRTFGEIDRGGVGRLQSKSGQELTPQSQQLFSDLEARQFSQAIVGYYHDYCALFTTARSCYAEPVQFFQGWRAQFERVYKRSGQFDFPYSVFLRQWHLSYERLHEQALRAVSDRSNAMVWIHINVPHPPSAQARQAPRDLRQDYQANLKLTAELIETIRLKLIEQGDEATLVLTSDHWLRERELWKSMYEQQRGPGSGDAGKSDDQRVPLIVWFSGAVEPLNYQPALSLMSMRSLVPALLQGQLRTPQDVAEFFLRQPAAVAPRSDRASIH